MTDGILLNEIQDDPMLQAYDAIIIDEAHERSLNIDFILGYLRQLSEKHKDLKIIITSATINTESFSEAFGNAPIIKVCGRMYPVDTRYRPIETLSETSEEVTYIEAAIQLIKEITAQKSEGDILVFLPGERDIHEIRRKLKDSLAHLCELLPLYGRLSNADQQRIFHPKGKQRVILSTNIAETSLTVPNIRYVIDTGLARISRYSSHSYTQRLPIEPIAQSSAEQRKGRCGRVSNGICYRLYSEQDFLSRPKFTTPEIRRSNLASVILRMLAFRLGNIRNFPFIEPPTDQAIRGGYRILKELGAIKSDSINENEDAAQLTHLGHQLARLPIDPTVARMLLQAKKENAIEDVLIIAAGLSIQDPRERPAEFAEQADKMHRRFIHKESDFLTLLNIWKAYHQEMEQLSQNQLRKFCKNHFISYQRVREWRDIHDQLKRILKDLKLFPSRQQEQQPNIPEQHGPKESRSHSATSNYAAIHRSILSGLLSNIGIKEEMHTYRGPRNRKAQLFPGSGLYDHKTVKQRKKTATATAKKVHTKTTAPSWIVCGEWRETSRLFACIAARIEAQWIEELAGDLLKLKYSEPFWSTRHAAALCKERKLLFGLEISCSQVRLSKIDPDEATNIFVRNGLVERGIKERPDFLQHNITICEEVSSELARRRLGSELEVNDRLFSFYRQRLQAVGSYPELRSFAKRKHGGRFDFIKATIDDLFPKAEQNDISVEFPKSLNVGGMEIPLKYQYSPNDDNDGVTLNVPFTQLGAIQQNTLDWAVPGHLEAKIESLLRSLPKQVRIRLHPLKESISEFRRQLKPSERTLREQLNNILSAQFGIQLTKEDWAQTTIPDYLQPRIQVRSSKGEIIASERNLSHLHKKLEAKAGSDAPQNNLNAIPAWQQATARIERENLTTWNFGNLPEEIDLGGDEGLSLKAFPALVLDNDRHVHLRLLKEKALALESTCQAWPVLGEIAMGRDAAWLHRDLKALKKLGMLLLPLGSIEAIKEAAWQHIFHHLFRCNSPLPLEQATFDKTLTRAKQECKNIIPLLIDQLQTMLEIRQKICLLLEQKQTSKAIVYPGMRAQMERIAPANLLTEYTFEELPHITRFLEAMLLRAQRARENIQRDIEKSKRVQPYEQKLTKLDQLARTQSQLSRLKQYRMLLEEFKVSVYAQELGTAQKVSSKRLDQLAQETES